MIRSLIKIAGRPVFWCSTKQTGISLSSTETEYIVTSEMIKNIITICDILVELDIILTDFAFPLLINNMKSIVVSGSEKIIWNARHVDIHYHHIRDLIQNSTIEVLHIPSRDMTADELTKALSAIKFKEFCSLIGLSKESLDIGNNGSSDDNFDNWTNWIRLNRQLYKSDSYFYIWKCWKYQNDKKTWKMKTLAWD